LTTGGRLPFAAKVKSILHSSSSITDDEKRISGAESDVNTHLIVKSIRQTIIARSVYAEN
jgi:hypothetical protein